MLFLYVVAVSDAVGDYTGVFILNGQSGQQVSPLYVTGKSGDAISLGLRDGVRFPVSLAHTILSESSFEVNLDFKYIKEEGKEGQKTIFNFKENWVWTSPGFTLYACNECPHGGPVKPDSFVIRFLWADGLNATQGADYSYLLSMGEYPVNEWTNITRHLNGTSPLSEEDIQSYTIDILTNYEGNYSAAKTEIEAYLNKYESRFPPLFSDRSLVDVSQLPALDRIAIALQQDILDHEFVLGNLFLVAGMSFEAADVFPGKINEGAERISNGVVEINRFPRVSTSFDVVNTTTDVANLFWGAIYISIPDGMPEGWQSIRMNKAIRSPLFSDHWRSYYGYQ